jgi:predicted nucleic acid-binding protein
MFLLDTNVVSEFRRPRPHGAVVAWVKATPASDIHISVVTFGEIHAGVMRTRQNDKVKALEIEAWARSIAATYDILPMDTETFLLWAELMHGKDDSLYEDAMIAATALQHDLTVVTRNIRDFETFGVPVLNPFEAA